MKSELRCAAFISSAANYIDILIEKGFKVAICEQTEDPEASQRCGTREVVS